MHLIAFVGACFVVAMVPGVSTAVILRQSLRAGRGSGAAAALGNESGILVWALAAVFGLSALVLASQLAYDAMRIVGAAVLVWMGVQSLRQARAVRAEAERPAVDGLRRSYLVGLGTCLANPKAAVFAMSFLPQFVPDGQNVPLTLVVLAVIWVLVDTLWYGLLIWTVSRAGAVLGRPGVRRRLERVSGTVLIGLGARLALETR